MNDKFKMIFSMCILILLFSSSSAEDQIIESHIDYRYEMRAFVERISTYAKAENDDFIVIPQNGQELLTIDGTAGGEPVISYLKAIDGIGREDLFYGYTGDNISTPSQATAYMLPFLELAEQNNIEVLSIDYCSSIENMDQSYSSNTKYGFISFAADRRGLDNIPIYPDYPYNMNEEAINNLAQAQNFLFLINPSGFSTKGEMISAIEDTNYDVIIIDLFDNDGYQLDITEIDQMKIKKNGAERLIIAYMSIGEAEDYRYYWKDQWKSRPPVWMEKENPNWKGNYKVRYWEPSWQDIILGSEDSYLDMILEVGFDGVYLDIIDGFEYFE